MDERLSEIVSGLRDAAEVGAEHALREFKARSFEVDVKPDGTSITTADEAVEQRIAQVLRERLPLIPLIGEESVRESGGELETFIAIDPIDGTSNFARGVPFFAVTTVYVEAGRPAAGVVVDPSHAVTYWVVRGEGAYRNGQRLPTPEGASALSGASVALPSESLPRGLRGAFLTTVANRVRRHQALRSVALEIAGLASGWVDAAVFNRVAVWDIGAASLLLEEVGGHWRSLDGTRPSFTEPRRRYSFCGAVRLELLEEILALVESESST